MTPSELQPVLEVFEQHFPGHDYTVEMNVDLPLGEGGVTDFKEFPIKVKVAKQPTVDLERHYLVHELAHVVCGLAADHNAQFHAVMDKLGLLCDVHDMQKLLEQSKELP